MESHRITFYNSLEEMNEQDFRRILNMPFDSILKDFRSMCLITHKDDSSKVTIKEIYVWLARLDVHQKVELIKKATDNFSSQQKLSQVCSALLSAPTILLGFENQNPHYEKAAMANLRDIFNW